ncbi:hypothetical protein AB0C68_30050 [Streptomyces tendae]|uniref:hypothetical protein n=1 Tax=Streptomyces tendae TaxID=1932 RepID=UPI0033D00076
MGYHRTKSGLRQSVESVIAKYRSDGTDRGDLLSMLLAAQDPAVHLSSEVMFSETELADQYAAFLFGGADTAADALVSCA